MFFDKQTFNEIVTLAISGTIGSIVKYLSSGQTSRKIFITGLVVGLGTALTLGKFIANIIARTMELELEGYVFTTAGFLMGFGGDLVVKKLLNLLLKSNNRGISNNNDDNKNKS